jgi:drug/metabolite transporter (DMT)-like permease
MGGTSDNSGINLGDILCTLCSLFFAIQIMLIARFVKRADAITLTVLQMGFVGVYSLAASFIFESPHLPATTASWVSSLLLSVGCTAIALLLQNTAQKHTTDAHAGIIFSTEPVFAVISAYIVLGETLSRAGFAGAAILLLCIVLLEA